MFLVQMNQLKVVMEYTTEIGMLVIRLNVEAWWGEERRGMVWIRTAFDTRAF